MPRWSSRKFASMSKDHAGALSALSSAEGLLPSSSNRRIFLTARALLAAGKPPRPSRNSKKSRIRRHAWQRGWR